MKIVSESMRPSLRGPETWFTGTTWIDEIVTGAAPSRMKAIRVTFPPGTRTAWHTHPIGQTLHVLSGLGRIQRKGEPPREICPGDTVVIEPGELHWHGAAPGHTMVHLALYERDEAGIDADWREHVTDEEYAVAPGIESQPLIAA
ncbi:MAG TPA: cupin domain-containing protein [Terracidiphilus sp.]